MKQLNWYQIFGNTHTIPEGSTVTPTDDVQILLHCANIWDKSYTTIGEVIADDDTLFLTLIDNNAIDYLVRSTTFASSIVADEESMEYIGASDYASDTLRNDSTWLNAIVGSSYYEYVLNTKNPAMTSNTTPSGVASASGTSANAWRAFAGNFSDTWAHSDGVSTSGYLQYHFPTPKSINRVPICPYVTSRGLSIKQFSISASNDNFSTSDTLYTSEVFANTTTIPYAFTMFATFLNSTEYSDYRLNILSTYDTSKYIGVRECLFIGREIGGVQSWLKAGGITNKKYTTVSEVLSDLTTLATLMSSSDAVDYLVTAKGWATEICSDSNAMADIGMNNYAANTLLADETWREAICTSTYFESVLNVKSPTMTDNTTPYGECFALSRNSYAYLTFDGNTATGWYGDESSPAYTWVAYDFGSAKHIYMAELTPRQNTNTENKIEASNDRSTWVDVSNGFVALGHNVIKHKIVLDGTNAYQCFRDYGRVTEYSGRGNDVMELTFYGRKDI